MFHENMNIKWDCYVLHAELAKYHDDSSSGYPNGSIDQGLLGFSIDLHKSKNKRDMTATSPTEEKKTCLFYTALGPITL